MRPVCMRMTIADAFMGTLSRLTRYWQNFEKKAVDQISLSRDEAAGGPFASPNAGATWN